MALPSTALLSSVTDPLFVLDGGLKYVFVNDRTAELVGRSPRELIGDSFDRAPIPDTQPSTLQAYERALTDARPAVIEQPHESLGLCFEHRISPVEGQLFVILVDVTSRRDAAQELSAILSAMDDVVMVIDREGRYKRIVPINAELLYRPSEELVGRTFRDVLPASQARAFEAAVRAALSQDQRVEFDYVLPIGDTERWFHAVLSPLDDEQVVWVARDINDRKSAFERLRTSEERFQQIAEAVRDVFWIADRNMTRFLYVSPAHRDIFGRDVAELRDPAAFLDRVLPEYQEAVGGAIDAAREGRSAEVTYQAVGSQGRTIWLSSRVFPVRNSRGEVYRLAGATTDISAQRQAEERHRQAMERLKVFLDTIPDQAWMKERNGRYVTVNEAFADARGLSAEAIPGRTDRELFPEELAHAFGVEDAHVLETGEPYRTEEQMAGPDRAIHWFDVLKAPVRDASGAVTGTVGIAHDITDRKAIESRVRHQALLFDTTNDAVIFTDAEGRVTEWNPAAARIFGRTAADAVGRPAVEVLRSDPEREGRAAEASTLVRSGHQWEGELDLVGSDGSVVTCETAVLPILDAEQRYTGSIAVLRDVTERRSLEEQLRQSQRLEAVGRLAGGVAHDFNNMLLVIQGFAALMEGEVEPDGAAADYLVEIRNAAERSARLTRQLLAYSRRQILHTEVFDLNSTVASLQRMLERTIGEDVDIEIDLDPEPCTVRADPRQIEQLLVNLALNARDAMPRGGRLSIRTRRRRFDGDAPAPGLPPGRYAAVSVEDTGCGMDEEQMRHIFEPFFTTKPVGEGTGLGLSMVYGIVRQSGGDIRVESEPDVGSTFRVLLPLVDAEPATGEPEREEPEPPSEDSTGDGRTILLLEDEPAVRELLTAILEQAGFSVLAAATGPDALALVEPDAAAVDLAILDVVLPGMSGREVADQLADRAPELPVLFISGHTDDHVLRHGIARSERQFLQKPVAPDVFLARVRSLLPRPRS